MLRRSSGDRERGRKTSPLGHSLIEEDRSGRTTLLLLLRIALVGLIVCVIGLYVVDRGSQVSEDAPWWELELIAGWPWVVGFALALGGGVIAIDLLTPQKKIATLSGAFLGLLAGVLAAIALGFLIDILARSSDLGGNPIITTFKVLIGIALSYLGVSIVLQTQNEFRFIIPYVEFSKQIRGVKPFLLDSSALIDGRVAALAECGALQAPLIIPRFVLEELQRLADSKDRQKRVRGRRGLDIVTQLQRSPTIDASVEDLEGAGQGVDQQLVDLAERLPAAIMTNDVALNRVAAIHGVAILNMNEVANALKPSVLPGDRIELRLLKPGEQEEQGVGYLDDGTMVVAEDGASFVGDQVTLTITSSLQTNAGRMIFGRVGEIDADIRKQHADRSATDGAATEELNGHERVPTDEQTSREPKGAGSRNPRASDLGRQSRRNPRRG